MLVADKNVSPTRRALQNQVNRDADPRDFSPNFKGRVSKQASMKQS
jgi:hypothetical protein